MAINTKEQFEADIKKKYDNLSKQEFGVLLNTTRAKLSKLLDSKELIMQKDKNEDDYIITYAANEFYERVFGVFKFVHTTKKLSFKQYKCLAAFINAKEKKQDDNEYKQF
jgi:hypothetical protein